MEVISQGNTLNVNPTTLDGKKVRYKLKGQFAQEKIDTVSICRSTYHSWIIVFENVNVSYDIRSIRYLEIIDE